MKINSKVLILPMILGFCNFILERAYCQPTNEVILNLYFNYNGTTATGGIETHLPVFSKVFTQHGIKNLVLAGKNSTAVIRGCKEVAAINRNAGVYTLADYDNALSVADIALQCAKYNVSIIICDHPLHIEPSIAAQEALRGVQEVKVIFMTHTGLYKDISDNVIALNKIQGIVAVNYGVAEYARELQKQGLLHGPLITWIPPFVNDEKFLHFVSRHTKQEFFTKVYALDVSDAYPIITMVARLAEMKSHALLLQAAAILRFDKDKKFHLMLAGNDSGEGERLRALAQELKIDDWVHFLGETLEVAELLYYSDIHLLASSFPPGTSIESFGLVHLEAALMKKPFVGAHDIGVMPLVNKDIPDSEGLRGMPFINGDVQSLADTLEFLLDHPDVCKKMGENAHDFVLQEFSSETTFNKWVDFFGKIKNCL